MERLKLVVATDSETSLVAPLMTRALEDTKRFTVSRCRISVVDIGVEIKPYQPDFLLVQAASRHEEEFNELVGFVKRVVRLPQLIRVAVQGPRLKHDQFGRIFAAGAEVWLDETLAPQLAAFALASISVNEHFYHPSFVRNPLGDRAMEMIRRKPKHRAGESGASMPKP